MILNSGRICTEPGCVKIDCMVREEGNPDGAFYIAALTYLKKRGESYRLSPAAGLYLRWASGGDRDGSDTLAVEARHLAQTRAARLDQRRMLPL